MDKHSYRDMWVYVEHDGNRVQPVSLELCCEIRKLADAAGEKLWAVIVGELAEEEQARILDCGVDQLLIVRGEGWTPFSVDAYTQLFTELCREYRPSAVFVGGTIQGRDFAPRFACRLPTGCTSDATELVYDQVGTIRPGTFRYAPTGRRRCETRCEERSFPLERIRTAVLNFTPDQADDSMNLADAEVIVCVGNAVKAEALPRYRRLAECFGGKLACTRPVFDRGLLPFKLVIGQSGAVVKPKLLFSFGVSGAVNHVTGFSDAGCIVAVNKDPDAAIFHYCDYGIVGDMDEICDLLLQQLPGSVQAE